MSIFFDNAATTWPKPGTVTQCMTKYFNENGVSPSRSSYKCAVQVEETIFETRQMIVDLINGEYSTQLIFTQNATSALNLAILGLIKPGDHVITTAVEHNSVIRPLFRLQDKGKIQVTWVGCNEEGIVSASDIEKNIQPNTRLIVLNHASNVTGSIQPIAEVGDIARKANIPFLVDASQTIGHIPIDVQACNIDLIAFPGHKALYGPSGTGALYINPKITLEPLTFGGTGVLSEVLIQPEAMPIKYESGTPNTVGIIGLNAGLKFIKETGLHNVREHEKKLRSQLLGRLSELEYIKVYGPKNLEASIGTLSFNIDGFLPGRVGFLLDEYFDIQVRAGLHCSPMIHKYIGTDPYGTVRVSLGHFNTMDEINQFVDVVQKIGSNRPAGGLRIPVATMNR